MSEKRLIDANEFWKRLIHLGYDVLVDPEQSGDSAMEGYFNSTIAIALNQAKTADAVEVVHGQRLYNAHEVAEIIADLFGDSCACNFNGIDEWLPFKCELQGCFHNAVGVACWEQYLKYRDAKMDGGNEDE